MEQILDIIIYGNQMMMNGVRVKGFMLPMQEVWVQSLVRELKPLSD